MDNKYELGSTKTAVEHHETHHNTTPVHITACKFCQSTALVLCQTMHDYRCSACGEWQNEVQSNYATGRSQEY